MKINLIRNTDKVIILVIEYIVFLCLFNVLLRMYDVGFIGGLLTGIPIYFVLRYGQTEIYLGKPKGK